MRHPSPPRPRPPAPAPEEDTVREQVEPSNTPDADLTSLSSKERRVAILQAASAAKKAGVADGSGKDGASSSSKSDDEVVRVRRKSTSKSISVFDSEQDDDHDHAEDDDQDSHSAADIDDPMGNADSNSVAGKKGRAGGDENGSRIVEGSDNPADENDTENPDEASGSRVIDTREGEPVGASEEENEERVENRTVHEIVSTLHKRGRAEPMPSTVARNLERRRKRLREAQGLGTPPPEEEALSAPVASNNSEPAPTPLAPQVRLDDEGNIVVDSSSLVVDAGNSGANDGASMAVVEHGGRTHVTSATFSKRESATRWRPEETEYFYHCLAVFGTDFSVMERAFRTRNRRQLKLKYKKEERANPDRIDAALAKPTDASEAARLLANPQQDDTFVEAHAAAVLAKESTLPEPAPVDTPTT